MACNDDVSVPVTRDKCPNYKKDANQNSLPLACKSCADKAHCYPKKKDGAEDDSCCYRPTTPVVTNSYPFYRPRDDGGTKPHVCNCHHGCD